jgi:hypothetical protein
LQRSDERAADKTDAGWFLSAPSENHFGTRARGRCRWSQRKGCRRKGNRHRGGE